MAVEILGLFVTTYFVHEGFRYRYMFSFTAIEEPVGKRHLFIQRADCLREVCAECLVGMIVHAFTCVIAEQNSIVVQRAGMHQLVNL